MTRLLHAALMSVALFVLPSAQAGTQALGFELGVSTPETVRKALAKGTRISDAGKNKYSGGPMIKTDGTPYGIEGLSEVLFIFDRDQKLSGILLTLEKSRFDAAYRALAAKYKVSRQERPFVGNQFAQFKTPDAVVELDAPHLSFSLEARYLSLELLRAFNTQSEAEAVAKQRNEASKF